MSLFADYIKEREGTEIIEADEGFATYQFYGKICYIKDIYIVPKARQKDLASKMADRIADIARSEYCDTLMGTVCLNTKQADNSIKVLMGYGMKPVRVKEAENMIVFEKPLGE